MGDLLTTAALSVLVVSFGVGIVVGLTGMGGGALMTPALIALGIDPTAAVANDLVAASVNKSVGAAVHWRQGSPNLRLAGLLVLGSVPCAFAGGFIVQSVGSHEAQQEFLTTAIGYALLLTAGTYALRMYLQLRYVTGGNTITTDQPRLRPVLTVLVGAVGGLLVGITSVGSGSLIMVALLLIYPTLSAVRLVGTDLVQAVPLVLAAAVGHVVTSGVDWEVLDPADPRRYAGHVPRCPDGGLGLAVGDPPRHRDRAHCHRPEDARFAPRVGGHHRSRTAAARAVGLGIPQADSRIAGVRQQRRRVASSGLDRLGQVQALPMPPSAFVRKVSRRVRFLRNRG